MTVRTRWIVGIILVVVVTVGVILFVGRHRLANETYGMSEYVDTAYGFSFWYPSTLQVAASATQNDLDFPGGIVVETLQVGSPGGVSIFVVNASSSSITDEPSGHASPIGQTKYFYDTASGQWMVAFPEGTTDGIAGATTTANISNTTMAKLPMLPSGRRFDTTIIPLSTTRFLVIGDGGGSSFTVQLAHTVSSATSIVDSSARSEALHAEATAFSSTMNK